MACLPGPLPGNKPLSATKRYRDGAFIYFPQHFSQKPCFHLKSLLQIVLPAYSHWNMVRILAMLLRQSCCTSTVCVCVHVFILTFSAHAHRPMPKNAAPSNCKTKRTEEASLSDGKQQ